MESQVGTLTLYQDQDISPVRDIPLYYIQCKATQIIRMHLQIHDQVPMAHQWKAGKGHPTSNSTRTMRLGGPTRVTASIFPSPVKG